MGVPLGSVTAITIASDFADLVLSTSSNSKAAGAPTPSGFALSPYVPSHPPWTHGIRWVVELAVKLVFTSRPHPSVQRGTVQVRQSKNSACVVALKLRSVDNSLLGRLSDAVLEPASKYSHQQHCHIYFCFGVTSATALAAI